MDEFKMVPLGDVYESPLNTRRHFDKAALGDLTISVATKGVLTPLLVRENPSKEGRFEILAGARRCRAAHAAQLNAVPIRVCELTDDEALEVIVVENLQREDVHPLEEAEGYRKLLERPGQDASARKAFAPVNDWYESDEQPPRSLVDKLTDAVADLQRDRVKALRCEAAEHERDALREKCDLMLRGAILQAELRTQLTADLATARAQAAALLRRLDGVRGREPRGIVCPTCFDDDFDDVGLSLHKCSEAPALADPAPTPAAALTTEQIVGSPGGCVTVHPLGSSWVSSQPSAPPTPREPTGREPAGCGATARPQLAAFQHDLPWGLNTYGELFMADSRPHRDFEHALIHIGKALGKLFGAVDNWDHDEPLECTEADIRKWLADVVICALRCANVVPAIAFDLGAAIVERLEAKGTVFAAAMPSGLVDQLAHDYETAAGDVQTEAAAIYRLFAHRLRTLAETMRGNQEG